MMSNPLKKRLNMAAGDDLQHLVLKGIEEVNQKEIGRGAYGRVYEVKYCETTCAAKELHSILLEGQGEAERRFVDSFLRECHQCSKLRHPNIIIPRCLLPRDEWY